MAAVVLQSGVTAPSLIFAAWAEVLPIKVDPAVGVTPIAAGQSIYQTAAGNANLASSAAATAPKQARGIALEGGGPRGGISCLRRGLVGGYNVASYAPGQKIYVGDTPGSLVDTPGTLAVLVGQVWQLSDGSGLAIFFEFNWVTGY
jgi:hypothetical protein